MNNFVAAKVGTRCAVFLPTRINFASFVHFFHYSFPVPVGGEDFQVLPVGEEEGIQFLVRNYTYRIYSRVGIFYLLAAVKRLGFDIRGPLFARPELNEGRGLVPYGHTYDILEVCTEINKRVRDEGLRDILIVRPYPVKGGVTDSAFSLIVAKQEPPVIVLLKKVGMQDPFPFALPVGHVGTPDGLLLDDAAADIGHHLFAGAVDVLVFDIGLPAGDDAVLLLKLSSEVGNAVVLGEALETGQKLHGTLELTNLGVAEFVHVDGEIVAAVVIVVPIAAKTGFNLDVVLFRDALYISDVCTESPEADGGGFVLGVLFGDRIAAELSKLALGVFFGLFS